jgi:hypothetical protein
MKKRSFFLLELMIGMVLLALSLPLLVRQPIYFLQSEIKNFQAIEYERIKDLSLLEIRKALYETPSLLKNTDPQKEYQLPPINLFESSSLHRTIFRHFFLSFSSKKPEQPSSKKEEDNSLSNKLLKIDLVLEDPLYKKNKEKIKKYSFFLFVQQKGKKT